MTKTVTILFIFAILPFIGCESGGTNPDLSDDDNDNDTNSDDDDDNDDDNDSGFEDDDNSDDDDDDSDSETDTECATVMIAVIRDFSKNHPDFEKFGGDVETPGLIQDVLGGDQKPVFKSTGEGTLNGQQLTGATEFNQWYRDTSGTNYRFEYPIELIEQTDGTFVYDNAAFYPLANDFGFGTEGMQDENGVAHNYHFTTEVHLQFVYHGGEVFTFRGDDDLWTFINNKLALDLGGLHIPVEKTVNLDTLGLTVGETYPLDIFHAERHTTWSNFKITTTIECLDPIVIE